MGFKKGDSNTLIVFSTVLRDLMCIQCIYWFIPSFKVPCSGLPSSIVYFSHMLIFSSSWCFDESFILVKTPWELNLGRMWQDVNSYIPLHVHFSFYGLISKFIHFSSCGESAWIFRVFPFLFKFSLDRWYQRFKLTNCKGYTIVHLFAVLR